jgi:hypothetical protein|uniref:Uncharacterized protein n=1 Tax=candidate division WOR-3 bacterium TaxID=2052148 RepID=A0A7C3Z0P5_UNCW3
MENLKEYFILDKVRIDDLRDLGGEVMIVPLRERVDYRRALEVLSKNLAQFIQKELGKGYSATKIGYQDEWLVREPGHQSYGLKLYHEAEQIIITRVAILEDESIFKRYCQYLRDFEYHPSEQEEEEEFI